MLISVLAAGTIRGAWLDVYEAEPNVPETLRRIENAALLPHRGSATKKMRTAMGMKVVEK